MHDEGALADRRRGSFASELGELESSVEHEGLERVIVLGDGFSIPSGTAEIDGATYNLVLRHTTGTGGDRCGGAGSWDQYYSIRLEGSRCGTITVSDHFDAWAARGWNLGNLLEVKIVVEAAGGVGSVDFPVADVKTSQ